MTISRRAALQGLGASGAAGLLGSSSVRAADALTVAGRPVELQIAPVGDHIVRITASAPPLTGEQRQELAALVVWGADASA